MKSSVHVRINQATYLIFLIGMIMYVGGIFSHIVIQAVFDAADVNAMYYAAVYKEKSAYILILPGLALKLAATAIDSRKYPVKPLWLKIQYACMLFLTVNAVVFLVPMMPEMTILAAESVIAGSFTPEYLAHAAKEEIIGISNAIPLFLMTGLSALGHDKR